MSLSSPTELSNNFIHNGLGHNQYFKVFTLFIYEILWKVLLFLPLKKILHIKNLQFFKFLLPF